MTIENVDRIETVDSDVMIGLLTATFTRMSSDGAHRRVFLLRSLSNVYQTKHDNNEPLPIIGDGQGFTKIFRLHAKRFLRCTARYLEPNVSAHRCAITSGAAKRVRQLVSSQTRRS